MQHMTRISVTLPDDLHEQLARLAASSNVSVASTVRAILSDVVPRMSNVMHYLGTAARPTDAELTDADAWLQDLQRLYENAPPTFRDVVGPISFERPPETGHEG